AATLSLRKEILPQHAPRKAVGHFDPSDGRRPMRKHSILSAVAIAAATLTYVFSPGTAAAIIVTHKCGKPVSSVVKTNNFAGFSTNATSFTTLPGATTTVDVGNGGCVKVRLFAQMRCSQTAN